MISAVVLRLESKLSSGFASAAVLTPACLGCTSTAMPVEVYTGGTSEATIPARASDISTPGTVTYHLTSRARTVSPKVMLHALPDLTTLSGHRAHGGSRRRDRLCPIAEPHLATQPPGWALKPPRND